MTTSSPITSRLLKGALVGLDPFNPVASVIAFQYNPENFPGRIWSLGRVSFHSNFLDRPK